MIVEGERLLLLERIEGGPEQFLGEVVQGGQAAIRLLQGLLVAALLQRPSRPRQLRTLGVDVHFKPSRNRALDWASPKASATVRFTSWSAFSYSSLAVLKPCSNFPCSASSLALAIMFFIWGGTDMPVLAQVKERCGGAQDLLDAVTAGLVAGLHGLLWNVIGLACNPCS